jgi:hypothetical protein
MVQVHAYNPSYSGGRDQEDHQSCANSSRDLLTKLSNTIKGWQSEALSSNPIKKILKQEKFSFKNDSDIKTFLSNKI